MKKFLLEWVNADSLESHVDEVVRQSLKDPFLLKHITKQMAHDVDGAKKCCYNILKVFGREMQMHDLEKAACKLLNEPFIYPCIICNKPASYFCKGKCVDNIDNPIYCSRECQKIDWNQGHKEECQKIEDGKDFLKRYTMFMQHAHSTFELNTKVLYFIIPLLLGSLPVFVNYKKKKINTCQYYVEKYACKFSFSKEHVMNMLKAYALSDLKSVGSDFYFHHDVFYFQKILTVFKNLQKQTDGIELPYEILKNKLGKKVKLIIKY
jgi:hypothetical protein